MKVLVTGHHGYIGSVMIDVLSRGGHEVTGFDTYFYEGCDFGGERQVVPAIRKDIRDVVTADLRGFDAVVHLAALSNDPLGCLSDDTTLEINHRASVRLAEASKEAGVPRFLFASSCSLYGAAGGDHMLDESAGFNPITAYGLSKVLVERDVSGLADDDFSPTFFRNATAYGASPRLRADVEVVIQSDGTPWRPLVHIEDISRAFLAALAAPRDVVHNQAFNVGSSHENYQIRDVAEIVRETVGCSLRYAADGGPDPRCYRVNCDKVAATLPGFRTEWTVRRGVVELLESFKRLGLTRDMFAHYVRLSRIQELRGDDRLDGSLRWRAAVTV